MNAIDRIKPVLTHGLKAHQFWGDLWVREEWRVQDHAVTGEIRLLNAKGKTVLRGSEEECRFEADRQAPPWRYGHAVILLHCLAGGRELLNPLEAGFQGQNMAVANIAYPNMFKSVSDSADRVRGIIDGMAQDGVTDISFAGHSIGGLVTRAICRQPLPVRLNRILYLGTPQIGSILGEGLNRRLPRPYQALMGPSGLDVLPQGVKNLPIPAAASLVIAGGTGGRGFNWRLPGDNDGVVTVAETNVPGASRMLVHSLHSRLPCNRRAIAAGVQFITTGLTPY